MRLSVAAAVLLVGCGRIGFDPLVTGQDGGGGSDAVDSASDAQACGGGGGVWNDGDVVTYTQAAWSDDGSAVAMLGSNFGTVYAASSGSVSVGVGFSMQFTSPAAVETYLPASGPPAALTADLVDPTTSPAGAFGGDVLALQLDVDFADAGFTTGTAPSRFGDLTLCGLTSLPALDGSSVRQFLANVNMQLGGGSSPFSIASTAPIAAQLTGAFPGGLACAFAAQHLVSGVCP